MYDKQHFILNPCFRRFEVVLQYNLCRTYTLPNMGLIYESETWISFLAYILWLTLNYNKQTCKPDNDFFTPKPKELFGLQFAPCKKLHEIALMHHAGQPAHIGAKSLMRFYLSWLMQGLLNRWTSQLDLACTTGGLERVILVHNST